MLLYEDLEIGTALPTIIKKPTTRQLVRWAGVSCDLLEIHYDQDAAKNAGLPGVIVHGKLMVSFLAQLVTAWLGTEGDLKSLSCSYRGMARPGEPVLCKGKVIDKYIKESQYCADCEIWVENEHNNRIVEGKATVTLPSRLEKNNKLFEGGEAWEIF